MKKTFYLSALLLFAIIVTNSSAQCPYYTRWPVHRQECSLTEPCGVYIVHGVTGGTTSYKGKKDYYDGIFINIRWDELLDQQCNYWNSTIMTNIFNVIDFARINSKQVSIGIETGESVTDCITYSIPPLPPMDQITQFGGLHGEVESLDLTPVPWDPLYIGAFKSLINHFHSWLETTPCPALSTTSYLIDFVTMVKLTGVTRNNVETRIPNQDTSFEELSIPSGACATDAVDLWFDRGYTPDDLIDAWADMAQYISTKFDDKYVNLVVVPDPKAFPPVACNGAPLNASYITDPINNCSVHFSSACQNGCYGGSDCLKPLDPNENTRHKNLYDEDDPCSYNVTEEIMRRATRLFSPCLAINSTFLNSPSLDPNNASIYPLNDFPDIHNFALIGYQQHHQTYTSTSGWTSQEFIDAMMNGMANHASFIELHENTIEHFIGMAFPPTTYDVMKYVHEVIISCECLGTCRTISPQMQNPLTFSSDGDHVYIKNNQRADVYSYTIYDVTGRLVKDGAFTANAGDNIMDTKQFNLRPSVYILQMRSQNGNASVYKMFIK